jgi:glycosyltransferase involved in cell wall biosynthesis
VQIVVNTRLLLKNKLEGIGWFSYQTLKRICSQNPDCHFVFLFDRPYHPDFVFSENVTPMILQPQARHPLLYYFYFQHSVKSVLTKLKPDLFLSPDGFLSLGAQCRQLPVIHDINFLHHPQDSKWLTSHYYNYYFPRFAKAANRIATVSEFSKSDISSSFEINPSSIDVVYNGINEGFQVLPEATKFDTRRQYSQGAEYFLHVGALHPRKNIARLIQAFSLFKRQTGSAKKLVLAGPEFWGLAEVRAALEQSDYKTDIVFTGRLEDTELQKVMGSAFALCLVSYYEGFGIPMVEAMASGVPVLASNTSCLPEITGPAAVLVDPFSIENMAAGLMSLEKNEPLYSQLIELGLKRSLDFSWDRSASLLWNSIQKTIEG